MPIKPHPTDPDKVVFVSHKPILNYDEQAARIRVLEKALVALDKDYERMKVAAQMAYRAMVAVELSDSSKREWNAAIRLLREALKGVEEKK